MLNIIIDKFMSMKLIGTVVRKFLFTMEIHVIKLVLDNHNQCIAMITLTLLQLLISVFYCFKTASAEFLNILLILCMLGKASSLRFSMKSLKTLSHVHKNNKN